MTCCDSLGVTDLLGLTWLLVTVGQGGSDRAGGAGGQGREVKCEVAGGGRVAGSTSGPV